MTWSAPIAVVLHNVLQPSDTWQCYLSNSRRTTRRRRRTRLQPLIYQLFPLSPCHRQCNILLSLSLWSTFSSAGPATAYMQYCTMHRVPGMANIKSLSEVTKVRQRAHDIWNYFSIYGTRERVVPEQWTVRSNLVAFMRGLH